MMTGDSRGLKRISQRFASTAALAVFLGLATPAQAADPPQNQGTSTMRGGPAAFSGIQTAGAAETTAPPDGLPPSAVSPAPPQPTSSEPPTPTAAEVSSPEDGAALRAWLSSPAAPHCALVELARRAGLIYAACGADGVLIVAPGSPPTLLDHQHLPGSVVGFAVANGKLVARVNREIQVEISAPSPTPPIAASTASAPLPLASPRGAAAVVLVTPDHVVIDLGRDDSIQLGTHIAFEDASQPGGRIVVGSVSRVSPHRARVELAVAHQIAFGSVARITLEPVTRNVERRLGGASFGLLARPFLGLASDGVGVLVDADLGYRFASPFQLRLVFAPIGSATSAQSSSTTLTGFLLASYDSPVFEAGSGLGAQTVNDSGRPISPGSGTLLPLYFRAGRIDGLNASLRLDFTLFHQEFEFTSAFFRGSVPIVPRWWLVLAAAGGSSGFSLFEAGVRRRFLGDGGSGTLDLLATAGASRIYKVEHTFQAAPGGGEFAVANTSSFSGAHLGLGFEKRF
jgi:hypothetical protein